MANELATEDKTMKVKSTILSFFVAIITFPIHSAETFPTVIEWKIAQEIPDDVIDELKEAVESGKSANNYEFSWKHRGIRVSEHDFTRSSKVCLSDLGSIAEIVYRNYKGLFSEMLFYQDLKIAAKTA